MTAKPEASETIQRWAALMGEEDRAGRYVLYSDHLAAMAKGEQREALWREYVERLDFHASPMNDFRAEREATEANERRVEEIRSVLFLEEEKEP